jgi:hypothetical protein
MGKKKLYSPYSVVKVGEAILGNNAGRLGGLVGVDRDVQLQLLQASQEKANYWRTKYEPYHALKMTVKAIARRYGIPDANVPLYYAFAQKVAKAYAMYPEDVAMQLERAYEYEFSTYNLDPDVMAEIADQASQIGKSIANLYHLS